jgi:formiminotetrahydrofolate cyclodeaminase
MVDYTEDQTVGAWLKALASRQPAPGGGAVSAMLAAQGAALVGMVTELTIGKRAYAAHETEMLRARDEAYSLRQAALAAADEDEAAFRAVMSAYALPKEGRGKGGGEDAATVRAEAIQRALKAAATTPLSLTEVAVAVVRLAGDVLPKANVNVISDVAVAAQCARAALDAAVVNVEVNLMGLTDAATRDELRKMLDERVAEFGDADVRIVARVREAIGSKADAKS